MTGSRATACPMLEYTERTDKFCQGLLSGQIGQLVDGLPEGFLAPVCLGRLMQSPEDRAVDYISATCVRILRYLALAASLLLPGLYAAMAMHHPEMLPARLLAASIESVERQKAGHTAPAAGLYLVEVYYEEQREREAEKTWKR